MFMQHHYLHNTLPYLQIAPIFTVTQLFVLQLLTNYLLYHKTQIIFFLSTRLVRKVHHIFQHAA